MKKILQFAKAGALSLAALGTVSAPRACAQDPVLTPLVINTIADTAVPIIVNALKPKPKATGLGKYEGYVMHANIAQVTVRAVGNDMSIQSFTLSQDAAAKMQQVIDKGGYQYGDKITIYYNQQNLQAVKFKGKPSPPL